MGRFGEWAAEFIRKNMGRLKPKIEHIHDIEWGKEEFQLGEDLQTIRKRTALTKIIQEPETETWINQAYTEKDVAVK